MKAIEKAWLGGLFEGEGSIALTGVNSCCLTIKMTDKDVVGKCLKITSLGTLRVQKFESVKKQDLWEWTVRKAPEVIKVLDAIEPFLGKRRGLRAAEARQRLAKVRLSGHCKHGHRMTDKNLHITSGGQRMCNPCRLSREGRTEEVE